MKHFCILCLSCVCLCLALTFNNVCVIIRSVLSVLSCFLESWLEPDSTSRASEDTYKIWLCVLWQRNNINSIMNDHICVPLLLRANTTELAATSLLFTSAWSIGAMKSAVTRIFTWKVYNVDVKINSVLHFLTMYVMEEVSYFLPLSHFFSVERSLAPFSLCLHLHMIE